MLLSQILIINISDNFVKILKFSKIYSSMIQNLFIRKGRLFYYFI